MSTRDPVLAALATYEILEDILLHLPLRQLLLSQRVNKAFLDVIQRSQNIQRALFLAPSSNSDIEFVGPGPDSYNKQWKCRNSDKVCRPLLNPFLLQKLNSASPFKHIIGGYELKPGSGYLFISNDTYCPEAHGRMLFSQPPIQSIRSSVRRRRHRHCTVRASGVGFTIDDLFSRLQNLKTRDGYYEWDGSRRCLVLRGGYCELDGFRRCLDLRGPCTLDELTGWRVLDIIEGDWQKHDPYLSVETVLRSV